MWKSCSCLTSIYLDRLCVCCQLTPLQAQREDLGILSCAVWVTGGPFFSWTSFCFFSSCSHFWCRQHRHLLVALVSKAIPNFTGNLQKKDPFRWADAYSMGCLSGKWLSTLHGWEDNSYNKQVVAVWLDFHTAGIVGKGSISVRFRTHILAISVH